MSSSPSSSRLRTLRPERSQSATAISSPGPNAMTSHGKSRPTRACSSTAVSRCRRPPPAAAPKPRSHSGPSNRNPAPNTCSGCRPAKSAVRRTPKPDTQPPRSSLHCPFTKSRSGVRPKAGQASRRMTSSSC